MASLAQPASSPSSSYFDRLPLELVKVIVGMVHAQDQAFRDSDFRAAPVYEPGVDVLAGEWSSRYGRGVAALSGTSKRLRELARPLLLETVTVRQLAKPAFRFALVNDATVSRSIKRVALGAVDRQDMINGASVLARLPNVERFDFNSNTGDFIDLVAAADGSTRAESEDAVAQAATTAMLLLQDDDTSNLRRLTLSTISGFSLRYPHDHLRLALNDHSQLEYLHLIDPHARSSRYSMHDSWRQLHLPSLRSLRLYAAGAVDEFIGFAHAVAPNLQRLQLDEVDSPVHLQPFPAFPRLTHLAISGGEFARPLVEHFSSAPVVSLTLAVESVTEDTCKYLLCDPDNLPASLRTFFCHLTLTDQAPDVEEYRARVVDRGINFHYSWTPNLYMMGPALAENGYPDHGGDSTSRSAAYDTLRWAKEQLDWAAITGDKRFGDEIVMALQKVRERQVIQTQ
ncbi:hypothetical protein JCM8097_004886 [Rhodosporidiobolus ruineniae]